MTTSLDRDKNAARILVGPLGSGANLEVSPLVACDEWVQMYADILGANGGGRIEFLPGEYRFREPVRLPMNVNWSGIKAVFRGEP